VSATFSMFLRRAGSADVSRRGAETIEVRSYADREDLLSASERYGPMWTTASDSAAADVGRVDGTGSGDQVTPGDPVALVADGEQSPAAWRSRVGRHRDRVRSREWAYHGRRSNSTRSPDR